MAAKHRSRRARIAALSEGLRAQGLTWNQIARRIAADEHVNMRVAFRLAHGLSQREVAARWCEEFPAEAGTASMSDKIISYWETWPQSGYEPSLKSLKRLARIYQCSIGDLADNGDYSHLDRASALAETATTPVNIAATTGLGLSRRVDARRPRQGMLDCEDEGRRAGNAALIPDSPQRPPDRNEHGIDIFNARGDNPEWARSPAIMELCAAITVYSLNPGRFCSIPHDEVPASRDLERDLQIAFNAYQRSRFTTAASRIATLLTDAQLAARECRETERTKVFRVLALSYQAAASVLTKVGELDIAWIAAERGFNAAEASASPAVRGSLIRSVAFALHSTGRFEPAMSLVESGAECLHSEISGNDAALSVYGTLFLVGSMAAARFGDGTRTADYLQEASNAAQRLGKDANHLWTAFGPTNVAIHHVNTAMELGNIQTVLNYGLSLNTAAVPTERQARYLLDIARAHSLAGNRDDALSAALTAERIAPEQVRQHYLSRQIVTTLMHSVTGRPTAELEKLAERVKISEFL
jgi:transcriptional regulator with XRE-family HTH domain/tetratricopeptide (TPR) repeat protein